MSVATILGYPRIGVDRALKRALERFWKGSVTEQALEAEAAALRVLHWRTQRDAGLDSIPSNDFSFYDQVLDMAALVGVVPDRFEKKDGLVDLDCYFAMARGKQDGKTDVHACEMTKWFDTNYHYIVPAFKEEQRFSLSSTKPFDEFAQAQKEGFTTRPVLIGPVSFLLLGKRAEGHPLELLDQLLPVYVEILKKLQNQGVSWVQFDEPYLTMDLTEEAQTAFEKTYALLRDSSNLHFLLTTPFGALDDNLELACSLPVEALHVDLVRGKDQLDRVLSRFTGANKTLVMGLVDGRNVWRNDLAASVSQIELAVDKIGSERVWVSSSCSLLHVPYDLSLETDLDDELKSWMAFAREKLDEIVLLSKAAEKGRESISEALAHSEDLKARHKASARIHNPAVKEAMKKQPLETAGRALPYATRQTYQKAKLNLPDFPTTTIGSFPQTEEVRKKRADFRAGRIDESTYDAFLKEKIKETIRFQEEVGLDVLVHGEFERNDMVEYFGEKLDGLTTTKNGWVQSYGSRCVKPPLLYGDVVRPEPMTVYWSSYAQSLTSKPVKGMLTGPVTIMQWSFVREDQPRSETAHQIALALQEEVLDLEKAGLPIIQIDEPAFREGLPLRRTEWSAYLTWATQAFRLASTGVQDATQIHTHMCYSEFNNIIDWIIRLDADVISIETSRSEMELLKAFTQIRYPNAIGPGVYDIHSPRVPSLLEIGRLLDEASRHLDERQIWVNPDCGLKTRDWPETKASLENMVAAAAQMRARRKLRRPVIR